METKRKRGGRTSAREHESERRARDPEATRGVILDAAEKVFLVKGFGNTATSEIAAEAGVTKSLIHHHFGSKEGLWSEVKKRRIVSYLERQMEMLQDAPPTLELLKRSLEFYFRFMEQNPEVVRILAWCHLEPTSMQGECADLDHEVVQAGVEKLREGQKGGRLRKDVDPRFMLSVFMALAHHWFQDLDHFRHTFDTKGLPRDLNSAYLAAASKIFLEGVLARD